MPQLAPTCPLSICLIWYFFVPVYSRKYQFHAQEGFPSWFVLEVLPSDVTAYVFDMFTRSSNKMIAPSVSGR